MKLFKISQALLTAFTIGGLLSGPCFAKEDKQHKQKIEHDQRRCFKHNIQLQLSDANGFPVDGTQFWVPLTVIQDGPEVTVELPVINFQTGPVSEQDPAMPLPGGYLYTSDGFLPEEFRPNDLVYRSIVAASNNGLSLPFSFAQPVDTLPTPPVGYIVQVTNAGAIVVQCPGTFGNIIPEGPQILMPCSITYTIGPKQRLCENFQISTGFINTTQFSDPRAAGDGFRDTHVNAACKRRVAWAWTDNSMVADKTNGTMNTMVAIGKIRKDGTIKVGKPIQLTYLDSGFQSVNTAVAINPCDTKNIVVSWSLANHNVPISIIQIYRAVSFDGGKTWPENGPLNIQPTGIPQAAADCRGIGVDRFGGFWYSYSNRYDNSGNQITINTPSFAYSSDKGVTFELVLTLPVVPERFYSYPQYCFGGNGQDYGLYFVVDFFNNATIEAYPVIGFIPIEGFNRIGTPDTVSLPNFINTNTIADITASRDGRVWMQGTPFVESTYINPIGVIFKSPGALDANYAGPWNTIIYNGLGYQWVISLQDSQPVFGYMPSVQSIIYDDKRQALYAIMSATYPDYSQNMRIYFIISRDNGQTWSDPLDISTTDFANRGFQSMALDHCTGDLVLGWYDGRHDPTYKSVQYFGAIIPAKKLDELVGAIPLSNPLYTILPPAGAPLKVTTEPHSEEKPQESEKLERKKMLQESVKESLQEKLNKKKLFVAKA